MLTLIIIVLGVLACIIAWYFLAWSECRKVQRDHQQAIESCGADGLPDNY